LKVFSTRHSRTLSCHSRAGGNPYSRVVEVYNRTLGPGVMDSRLRGNDIHGLFRKMVLLLLLFLLPIFSHAETSATPPEIKKYFGDKAPLAEGKFTWLGLKIYDGKLWAKGASWSYDKPFALNLKYARDIDAEDLVSNSIDEMHRIRGLDEARLAEYKKYLEKVFPDVNEGDTITAIYFPKQKVIFYHNSQISGEVDDPNFGPDFMDIWLSPKTKATELYRSLNGEK